MRTLATTVPVRTRFGILQATHEAHSVRVVDEPTNSRIISDKTLVTADIDGALSLLPEARRSVDILGADLAALGDAYTMQDISAKHDEIVTRTLAEQEAAAAQRAAALQLQIDQTEAQLQALLDRAGT